MSRFYLKNGLVHFRVDKAMLAHFPLLSELPSGIAIEGGAARAIARRLINGEYEPVRDTDLVCLASVSEINNEVLDKLSMEYCEEDYSHGHSIQRTSSEEYFLSRDFTVNEVLVTSEEVILTPAAFRAIKLGIVRPSENERQSIRTWVKAQYLGARIEAVTGEQPRFENLETFEDLFEEGRHDLFQIALFANKALGCGEEVADHFFANLGDFWGFYNSNPATVAEAAMEISEILSGEGGWFDWRSTAESTIPDPVPDGLWYALNGEPEPEEEDDDSPSCTGRARRYYER